MEDTLGYTNFNFFIIMSKFVLILVLMEDTLGSPNEIGMLLFGANS